MEGCTFVYIRVPIRTSTIHTTVGTRSIGYTTDNYEYGFPARPMHTAALYEYCSEYVMYILDCMHARPVDPPQPP